VSFWIALTIFVDPGGIVLTYIERNLIGGLKITDISFLILLIPLISNKINFADYFKNKDVKWFLIYSLFFAISYHIMIFGLLAHGNGLGELLNFIQYQRLTLFGFLLIIPSYIFFIRSYKYFFKIAVYTSAILMILYLITLLLKINILPLWEFERSRGSGIMRISLLSYGFADWLLIVFASSYFFNLKIPYKKLTSFIGATVFIAIIITLTRRTILSTITSILTIYFIYQKYTNKNVFSLKTIIQILFLALFLFTGIFIIKPEYIDFAIQTYNDTILLITTGKDIEGIEDDRFDNDIPKHLERFSSSPFFGSGYNEIWYSNDTENGGLSANDVPLTAALGMFGIFGLILFTPYYIKIVIKLIELNSLLKFSFKTGIAYSNTILFSLGFFIMVNFIIKYTLNFMSFFEELTRGSYRLFSAILIGFLLAIIFILKKKKIEYNNSNLDK
jgi:hypothetical protein